MGKKQMARRTPPKKQMEGEKKEKGKVAMHKGKEKVRAGVSFRDPMDTDEREDTDGSEEISDETEASSDGDSGDEEDSAEEEASGEEEKQVSESEDGGLAEVLNEVVKMAAALGEKKKRKEDKTLVDETVKVMNVVEISKEVEVGQGSKRKLPEGAVVPKKKRKRKEGTKLKGVEGHGAPASLHYVIEHLSSAQRKDVEDIGFGGLLELKASKFIHTMVDWLLERYDTHTRLMLFNRFVHFSISKHDVYDVFMLPCGGEDVPTVTEDKELVHSWRESFGALLKKDIQLDKVRGEMLQLVDDGSDFKRTFVLFAMGSFLAPTVHNRIDTRLIGAVENVAAIPKMDWCSYILDRFDQSVESWKGNESKSIGGCLMFFQLVYFHHLIWRGEPEKRTLPLIRHWTYDELKKRVKEECKAYSVHRGFGIGVWDLTTHPISINLEKSFYYVSVDSVAAEVTAIRQEAARPAEMTDAEVEAMRQEAARAAEKDTMAEDNGCRTVTFTLPDDLPSDEDLRFLYNDARVLKLYQTKRNQKLISRLHRDMAREMMADPPLSQQVRQQQDAICEATGEAEETFSQKLDSDLAFYAEFNAMLDQVDTTLENVVLPPSFDLAIDEIGGKPPGRSYELRYTRARDRAPGGPVSNSAQDVTRAPNRPVPKPGAKKKVPAAVSR